MRPIVGVCVLVLFGGCATYSSYRCPAPIGEIVRQDCEDYRVRYESLKAKLSFSIGSFSVGAGVEKEKLRDPSELVQVMMHRMLALCHDYNACRISNAEYQRRREEADRVFTGMMALLDQLKAPGLDTANRKNLLDELLALLGVPHQTGTSQASPGLKHKPTAPRITAGAFRSPFRWWYASKFTPPRPPPAVKGVPSPLEVMPYYDKDKLSHFFVRLWGEVEEDDSLTISAGSEQLRCGIKRRPGRPEGTAECRPRSGEPMPQATRFRASYTVGATGEKHDFGDIDLSPEPLANKIWLAYHPDPIRVDPVTRERPWLVVFAVTPKTQAVTARCFANGKPVIVGKSGAIKALTDIGGGNRQTHLTRYAVPLPYVLAYPGSKSDDEPLADHAGSWRCKVSFDGAPRFETSFIVKKDGTIEPNPMQRGRPGDISSPWWLLESKRR